MQRHNVAIGYSSNEIIRVNILKHYLKMFNDLIDTFKNTLNICDKLRVYLQFELPETDKTFTEIAQIFKKEKIEKIYVHNIRISVKLINHIKPLLVLINHNNRIEYLKKSYELSFESRISVVYISNVTVYW